MLEEFLEELNELYKEALEIAKKNGHIVYPINSKGEILEYAKEICKSYKGRPSVTVMCTDGGRPTGYNRLFNLADKLDPSFHEKRKKVRSLGQEVYSYFHAIELLRDSDSEEDKAIRKEAKEIQDTLPRV
jgi:hypothetical protein